MMDLAKLKTLLIKHEGLKLRPYVDTVGKLTIGVGHNLSDVGITATQAMSILEDDLRDVTNFLDNKLPWWKDLDDVRQRVLADMTFNLGPKILDFKNTLEAIRTHDWVGAKVGMLSSKWATQVGARAIELAKMMETGHD